MQNKQVHFARDYHNGTKHPRGALFEPQYVFDAWNTPRPFKSYAGGEEIQLPLDRTALGVPALRAISTSPPVEKSERLPDRATLARILFFSGGITKRLKLRGIPNRVPFRAAACTGALYHIELYIACSDLPGLPAGLYHFDPEHFSLRRLRAGDQRAILVEAGAHEPSLTGAPVILICTDVYWRNAYKYQARAYRHAFWDCGTILANTLAITAAHELPSKVVLGFVDEAVERFLGLESEPEIALALVPIGAGTPTPPIGSTESTPIEARPQKVSSFKTEYPAIERIHSASSLQGSAAVKEWRAVEVTLPLPAPTGQLFPLQHEPDEARSQDPLEQVIIRRGSTRRFTPAPLSIQQLSILLDRATRGVPGDFLKSAGITLNHLYLIVNAVEGLPSGAYVFHRQLDALELLKEGDFRGEAGYLGLSQALPAEASANIFFLTDLDSVLQTYGNRGYRAAQLEASITAGRMYLAAYAQGFGASGLTFYDDATTAFFSPHARGKSIMFLIALGKKREVR